MGKSKIDPQYVPAKLKAKQYYGQIVRIWCPALDSYINFNRSGFRHLIWKKSDQRTKKEQQRRFALLPYAARIISAPEALIKYQERNVARFWAFTGMYDDKPIKLIVRRIGNKQKHFFSIFKDK